MADQTALATILHALTSIDQRLSRIEGSLRQPGGAAPALGPLPPAPMTPTPAPSQSQPPPPPPPLSNPSPPPNASMPLLNAPGGGATLGPVTFRALEPPPQGYTITSRATMQEELDQWTIPRGYSMRIAGAKVTGKKKVRWVCFRGGEARHHRAPVDDAVIRAAKAEGRRKPTTDRASKKCGCMFKFELIETVKGADVWTLHYPNELHKMHNHPPSDQTSDPRARKLPAFMLTQVDQWLAQGWQVAKIQDELRTRGFTNVLNTDLYNRKRLLKKDTAPPSL
ncbi:hypothetical protein P8C59_000632 [Phyllachora maydis]|uniref:Uncharacterized protein n=1 Tax=Phyllachora maydis TaxID=1825666 RepID=A0AAD9HWU1_9PEZI|nr:hypothetical protein P8C59_000632 [Phyllachora maydis]